jgi:heme A synthase
MGALVIFLVAGAFSGMFSGACRAASAKGSYEHKLVRGLNWVLLLQLATGLANVALAWPLAIAVLHNGGAAALALLLSMLASRLTLLARQPGLTSGASTSFHSAHEVRGGPSPAA